MMTRFALEAEGSMNAMDREVFRLGFMATTLQQRVTAAEPSRRRRVWRLRRSLRDGVSGPLDAYQILLMLPANTERHTTQIREVKKTSGFPER